MDPTALPGQPGERQPAGGHGNKPDALTHGLQVGQHVGDNVRGPGQSASAAPTPDRPVTGLSGVEPRYRQR